MRLKLFVDCDGVLADFDTLAEELFGMPSREYEDLHGGESFWQVLEDHPAFFEHLSLMPDATYLWERIAHLNPTILTGCPKGDWAQPQKMRWVKDKFGSAPLITCRSRDKRNFMEEDALNVIIDDWPQRRALWEEHGGIWIHHTSARESLLQLQQILRSKRIDTTLSMV